MASLERDAQLVAEQLEVEIENGGGVSKVSREAMLEFLSRLARYDDGNAERGSSSRPSTAPSVRDSLSEVRYRTEPDSSVRNYLCVGCGADGVAVVGGVRYLANASK